ncbi:hypothetical protein RJ035_002701 [Blastomyces gilchristii]
MDEVIPEGEEPAVVLEVIEVEARVVVVVEVEEEGMECLVSSKPSSNPQDQDPKVMKVEDALHPMTKKTFDLGSLKLIKGFPSCPGYGTRGTKVELTTNYIELLLPSSMILYQYGIQISPEAVGRKRSRFSSDETIIEVHYCSEDEDEPAARATTYKVRVLYMKSLNLGQSFVGKQELMQALNIFLNHYAKSADNLATIGLTKSFSLHQNAARGDLSSGLKVIQGFFLSVRIATCHILVNINISHGAFYHTGPLPALMSSYSVWNTVALEKFLKLVQVQTTHLPEKRNRANEIIPRVKTIFGLARMDDGLGMAHPPCVRQHGAGAKDVEFWLDGEASSPGALKAEAKGQGQRDG